METAVLSNDRIAVISNSNFKTAVLETERPILLMCTSKGQGDSNQADILEQILDRYDNTIGVCRLEEDFINGFKQMYEIKGTPVFLLFEKGRLIGRMLGLADRERLESFLTRNLLPGKMKKEQGSP